MFILWIVKRVGTFYKIASMVAVYVLNSSGELHARLQGGFGDYSFACESCSKIAIIYLAIFIFLSYMHW